jgi:hypothetical protein
MDALPALPHRVCPLPLPSRPHLRTPDPRWSRRHSWRIREESGLEHNRSSTQEGRNM